MKAAVLHRLGKAPRYEDFPDPVPGQDELLLHVKAVALDNVDKAIARGSHYASRQLLPQLPAIVGSGGIGALDDGRLVGFGGARPPYGSLAELVSIPNGHYIPIPGGVDAATAAAVPASALTALLPLRWGVRLQAGESVLVNGATGFSGKLAIQVAKLLGAGRVVGSGRDEHALRSLAALGADAVIDLKQSDKRVTEVFKREAGASGYDVILDFLWGRPTKLLLTTLVPSELTLARRKVRLVQIGEAAGGAFPLPPIPCARPIWRSLAVVPTSRLSQWPKVHPRSGSGSRRAPCVLISSGCRSRTSNTPGGVQTCTVPRSSLFRRSSMDPYRPRLDSAKVGLPSRRSTRRRAATSISVSLVCTFRS